MDLNSLPANCNFCSPPTKSPIALYPSQINRTPWKIRSIFPTIAKRPYGHSDAICCALISPRHKSVSGAGTKFCIHFEKIWISPASDLRHFTQFRGALFPFHSSRTRVPCSQREQNLSSSFVRKRYLSNNVACTTIRAISLSHDELRISCRI